MDIVNCALASPNCGPCEGLNSQFLEISRMRLVQHFVKFQKLRRTRGSLVWARFFDSFSSMEKEYFKDEKIKRI